VRQRLYEYLLERPAGATVEELLDLVFLARGRDPEFGPRFLRGLVGEDPRFRFDADERRWRARVHDVLARPLADTSFVVVDLETTGGAPDAEGITEIGAVRVVGGRLADAFTTLVNPGRPIPPFVVGLTGITDEMVATAPPIAEALPRFLAFAGSDAVIVAHNAAFDVGHLNAAQRALVGRAIDGPTLCTLRLARRLLPEQKRRSLDAVADTLGIGCPDRHRALPDARIAAEILCVFLERVAERGVVRLDQLLDFQRSASDGRPFVVHVPRSRLDDVPATPGVYHLLGEDGRLLYVGKARQLRVRLASYFTNARGHSPKTLELIRTMRDLRTFETGSELAASLLEARQIRELKPPFNRQRRHLPRVGFLKLGVRNAYPRLWVTQRLSADGAIHVGPFPSVQAAERAQSVLGRLLGLRTCAGALAPSPDVTPCVSGQVGACTAPCAARVDAAAYRRQVDACVEFLDGRDAALLDETAARRDRMAAEDRFEAAARAQRDLDLLEEIRRRQRTLAWIVTRQHFAVLLPTAARDAAQLYVVLGGRLVVESRLEAAADVVAAEAVVRERFEQYRDAPLGREDVEGATILAAWLRDRGQEGILLPLDGPDALARRLDEITVTLHDLRQRGPLPSIDGLGG
jgi:DNA polymerase-3 subunit epsilon